MCSSDLSQLSQMRLGRLAIILGLMKSATKADFVMSSHAGDIDRLLSKSSKLAEREVDHE